MAVVVNVGCLIAFDTLNDDGTKVVPRVLIDYSHERISYVGVDTTSASSIRRGELVFDFDLSGAAFSALGAGSDPGGLGDNGIWASANQASGQIRMRMRGPGGVRIAGDSLDLYGATSVAWTALVLWDEPPIWSQSDDQ